MSLINDALKRALHKQKKTGDDAPAVTGMTPTLSPQPPKSRRTLWLGLLLVVTLIVVGKPYLSRFKPRNSLVKPTAAASTNNTAKSTNSAKINGADTNTSTSTNAQAEVPHPAGALLLTTADLETIDTNLSASTNALTTDSTNKTAAAVTSELTQPLQPLPSLSLKAIIYSKTSSKALINGSTVSEGDEVEGVKIVRIERDKVIVKWGSAERQILLE